MSNKLEEARSIINEVDAQMAELFVKRMRAAELVYEYKSGFEGMRKIQRFSIWPLYPKRLCSSRHWSWQTQGQSRRVRPSHKVH